MADMNVVHSTTSGMGIDEFLVRDQPSESSANGSGKPTSSKVRTLVRDLFLDSGLGENLCMIAIPFKAKTQQSSFGDAVSTVYSSATPQEGKARKSLGICFVRLSISLTI